MEMLIPYSIYSRNTEKELLWKIKRRREGNHNYIMQIQKVDIIAGAVCKDHVH